uniref:Uncharacterized protein n=1 Tax=Anguilla anguilla TaxID=7936 RepID=A0A0E9R8G8_ANGAN
MERGETHTHRSIGIKRRSSQNPKRVQTASKGPVLRTSCLEKRI